MPALQKSVPAVKGDAARSLFKVKCDEIRWAVLDSGIDGNHPAFYGTPIDPKATGDLRIVKAYDFRNIRRIVSLDNEDIDKPILRTALTSLRVAKSAERRRSPTSRNWRPTREATGPSIGNSSRSLSPLIRP
jgi:hypothetical protein